ncbi:hypothetical protein GPJ56_010778 [Histomonas meleagridis]|uniref:uncharacterized protein n=1 Tax=Histomonas meleagridis TaxID=135588 RepID=UPI00355A048B|nr:hypothetical protein GPJ56_010778 [Histomonas meleagridis]KAH0801115.1 hypothetical protein GO595_006150 [Histomonas meleagridis]
MTIYESLIQQNIENFGGEPIISTSLTLNIKASVPDRLHTGKRIQTFSKLVVEQNISIRKLVVMFQRTNPEYIGYDFVVKYNNRLFQNGTLRECGITNKSTVELISLTSEKADLKNQGFILGYWSLVPLMLAISFFVGSLGGKFDITIRGIFFIIGCVIGVPSFVCFVIGISEIFPDKFGVSFVGDIWFGPCGHHENENEPADELSISELENQNLF